MRHSLFTISFAWITLAISFAPNPASAQSVAKQDQLTIGIDLDCRRTHCIVTRVHPGSPAARMGIRRGDRVIEIHGQQRFSSSYTASTRIDELIAIDFRSSDEQLLPLVIRIERENNEYLAVLDVGVTSKDTNEVDYPINELGRATRLLSHMNAIAEWSNLRTRMIRASDGMSREEQGSAFAVAFAEFAGLLFNLPTNDLPEEITGRASLLAEHAERTSVLWDNWMRYERAGMARQVQPLLQKYHAEFLNRFSDLANACVEYEESGRVTDITKATANHKFSYDLPALANTREITWQEALLGAIVIVGAAELLDLDSDSPAPHSGSHNASCSSCKGSGIVKSWESVDCPSCIGGETALGECTRCEGHQPFGINSGKKWQWVNRPCKACK